MSDYSVYFDNILSRSWVGKNRKPTAKTIEKTSILDLYLNISSGDKIILVGRTEKFYFILECFDSDGFKYSNGLFNDDLADLLLGYKLRDVLTNGAEIENFVSTLKLRTQLSKELKINDLPKIKSRKI